MKKIRFLCYQILIEGIFVDLSKVNYGDIKTSFVWLKTTEN